MNEEILSEYWSDDGRRKAVIVNVGATEREWGTDMVRLYEDGYLIESICLDDEEHLERIADDFVLGEFNP